MLMKTLEALGLYALASRAASNAKAAALRGIFYGLAGLVAVVGIGCFIAAIWIALAQAYGSIAAALWIGGGLIALALLLVGLGVMMGRPPAVSAEQALLQASVADPVQSVSRLLEDVEKQFKGKKGNGIQSAVAVAAAGFILARLLRR